MGRHSVVEAPNSVRSVVGAAAGPATDPRPTPAPVLATVPPPRRSVTATGPAVFSPPSPPYGAPAVAPVLPPVLPPAAVWPQLPVPPGFHAPPAGLDAPLPPAAPHRTPVGAWIGAAAAGVAMLAATGLALGALADVAGASATGPTTGTGSTGGVPTAAAEQCSDTVATMLDDTVTRLAGTPSSTWVSTVDAQQDTLAASHGHGSPEYIAYTDGARDIVTWLADPYTTESYAEVVDRVVPGVVATCDRG